ncbi:thiopurine S-methyltransferase [bacterium]|nr:thiopurine S-methyltransferase [bacterium]
MDESFWHNRWKNNEIAFHEGKANALLVKHFSKLSLVKGSRIFVPLCGKTADIHWLLSQGYHVAGAELSSLAIDQLFTDLGVQPKIDTLGKLTHYSANNIDIFVGNIFDLTSATLGSIDAIYDRAALLALPQDLRKQYTAHLTAITNKAPQLMIVFEYDQTKQEGPPFSISTEEIKGHYEKTYHISFIEGVEVPGGLKGKCAATENIWLIDRKRTL